MNKTKSRPIVRSLPQSLGSNQVMFKDELADSYSSQGGLLKSLTGNQKRSLEGALKNIFPEQKEETKLQKARQIMGDAVVGLTDQELEGYLTEFQYLVDCWLDEFEKSVFNNLTLKELLREV